MRNTASFTPWAIRWSSHGWTTAAAAGALARSRSFHRKATGRQGHPAHPGHPKNLAREELADLAQSESHFHQSGISTYFRTAPTNTANTDDAVRRTLEWCGYITGAPCLVVAVDDVFVVPIPATMKATDIFRAGSNTAIAPELRADVARRLANATSGWNVVAVGSNGRAGLGLRASKEQDGITSALADCNRQDRNCRVIAIGPFSVEPLPPSAPEIVMVDTKAAVAANDRGKAAFAKKDYDQAIAEYTEAIRIDPKYRDAYFNRGTTYHFGKRDYDRAIADYTQAIQLDPKIADSFSARGVAYFDSKQYDLAITDQTEAIRLDHNSRDAYFRRGVVYRNGKRDSTHAVADFTEAIRLI